MGQNGTKMSEEEMLEELRSNPDTRDAAITFYAQWRECWVKALSLWEQPEHRETHKEDAARLRERIADYDGKLAALKK
jgi:hypothetical protein